MKLLFRFLKTDVVEILRFGVLYFWAPLMIVAIMNGQFGRARIILLCLPILLLLTIVFRFWSFYVNYLLEEDFERAYEAFAKRTPIEKG